MSIDLRERLSHLGIPGVLAAVEAITDGELSLAMGEASQLSVTLLDADGSIVGSKGASLGKVMKWADMQFTISSIDHGPNQGVRETTLTGRTRGWQALKKRKGDKTWRGLSPSAVVESECRAVGLKAITQKTAAASSISRVADGVDAKSTSDLDLFGRLASEQGFVFGEVGGTFYFGAPSWLVKRTGWAVAGDAEFLLEYPRMSKTNDDKDNPARISLSVAGQRPQEVLLPFSPVQLTNVPAPYRGRYLVSSVTIPLGRAEPATVELVTPVDPEKQK